MENSTLTVKQFKVTDVTEAKKYLVLYETYQTFVKKCKAKSGVPDESYVYFVSADDTETELDSDILEKVQVDKSVLIMKAESRVNKQPEQQGKAEVSIPDESYVYVTQEDCIMTELEKETLKKIYEDKGVGKDKYVKEAHIGSDCCEDTNDKDNRQETDLAALNITEDAAERKWRETEEGEEVKDHILKFGLNDIGNVLKKNLNTWKTKPLNIAVIGASGKGKSSFINALRGMSPRDDGAAKVGAKETTTIPTPYRHPERENFVLWDIPGAGTMKYPCETYLKIIDVDRYDFFIIITTERFTEIDNWLMNEIQMRQKRFYMVRTKIDLDLANLKHDIGPHFDEMEAFSKLKIELKLEIEGSRKKGQDFHFFMISNHNTRKYDFRDLEMQLVNDVPKEKKSAMVFGVAGISQAVVEEKAEALRSRIWKIALLSAGGEAIPIPFLSIGIDAAIILEEVFFYRSQFALDDDSLGKLAKMADLSLDEFKQNVNLQTPQELFTVNGMAQLILSHTAAGVAEKIAKFTIPILGTLISCSASYGTTSLVLNDILETMQSDAFRVLHFVAKQYDNKTD